MINSVTGEKISQKRVIKKTIDILFQVEGIEDPQIKGVGIEELSDKEIRLEVYIKTKIGYPIPKVAQMAQRKIKEEIEEDYKIKVSSVDVNVLELQF